MEETAEAYYARLARIRAYNIHGRAFYDRCEAEIDALRPMRKGRPWNDPEALRAAGQQGAWIMCQASQAAAHLRGDGEDLTVARLLEGLRRRLGHVQQNHDAEREGGPLRIQYAAERETLKQLIAQLEAGELYQNFEYAIPVER